MKLGFNHRPHFVVALMLFVAGIDLIMLNIRTCCVKEKRKSVFTDSEGIDRLWIIDVFHRSTCKQEFT